MKVPLIFMCLLSCSILAAQVKTPAPQPGAKAFETFTPPADHPRILIRKDDIPAIRERLKRPEAKATLEEMKKIAVPMTDQEKASTDWTQSINWMNTRGVTMQSELDALSYLLEGDETAGRRAITSMLDTLKRAHFGTQGDMTRPCGEMMFIGGLVFDWCHPLLTKSEKEEYVKQIVRCGEMMECGWPFEKSAYICGHFSEKMIMRDFLAAGLAIYEEYPEMFEATRKLLIEKYIAGRDYVFQGGGSHQGAAYISPRLIGDLSTLWLLDRAGLGQVFGDQLGSVMYDMIYRRIDECRVMTSGDCYNLGRMYYPTISMLSSSYFKDPYVAYEYTTRPTIDPHMLIFDLLCRDYDLESKSPDSLPLTRYFGSPTGSMISRTGWDRDAAIVEMRMIERFVGDHQHLDAGTFYIHYKSPLALDSGFYQGLGGHYNDAHNKCYSKRTIAHNGLLIYDPDESFGEDFGSEYGNDGGQRIPEYGRQCPDLEHLLTDDFHFGTTLSHWFNEDFSLLKCDITPAYRSTKASDVKRSFVYMDMHDSTHPAALVVYDHVVSTNPEFKKIFLLHTQNEPATIGNTTTITADGGMLRCTTLLPQSAEIVSVGGEGKEFWVFGQNYAKVDKKTLDVPPHIGRWRLEISPSNAAKEDTFFNVIQIADEGATTGEVTRIDGARVVGAAFDGRIVLFSRNGQFISDRFCFTLPKGTSGDMLVTDLSAGEWQIAGPRGAKTVQKVDETSGCILIKNAGPGKFTLKKVKYQ